jgi:hypothetical protein
MLRLLGQLALVLCYHVLAVAGVQQPLFRFYLVTRTQSPGDQEVYYLDTRRLIGS